MKNNKGFSLVELIIVIAIMAVLIGLLAPQYLRFVKKSKVSSDLTNAQSIATAFNVAFAEGTAVSSTSGNGGTTLGSYGIEIWPEAKSTASTSATWSVVMDSDGVSKIYLGGTTAADVVWPNPGTNFAQ